MVSNSGPATYKKHIKTTKYTEIKNKQPAPKAANTTVKDTMLQTIFD